MRFMIASPISICLLIIPLTAFASDAQRDDQARLTLGVPLYVYHSDSRGGGRKWNEGWFHNEGALIDATWPIWKLNPSTRVRLGVTGGVFDNSIFRTSVFAGGAAEIETRVSPPWAFRVGTYAGAITGYEHGLSPALTPYAGTSYALSERVEVGLRGFWLPAKTLAGSDLAPSDAYVAAVTVGFHF